MQCLDNEHRSSVVKVAWTKTNCASKHLADRMTLASSDTSGKILVSRLNPQMLDNQFHPRNGYYPQII